MGDRNFGDEIVAMGTGEEELLRADESMGLDKRSSSIVGLQIETMNFSRASRSRHIIEFFIRAAPKILEYVYLTHGKIYMV
jgi:hypothetical protein